MAHVVGVPKREPCQKCSLPVFLAERLTVGANVYHRTCLKCARCSSQLALGSFYETEIDGEFCCETCPDEEKELGAAGVENVLSPLRGAGASPGAAARSSIADRLAFFEAAKNEDKKLLQKSVSDEEKSQSLKKMSETPGYKMNSALSSFMNETLDQAADAVDAGREEMESDSSESEESDEDESTRSEAPQLPSSPPPVRKEEEERKAVDISPTFEAIQKPSNEEISNGEHENKTGDVELFTSVTSVAYDTPTVINKNTCNDIATKDNSGEDDQMRTTNSIDPETTTSSDEILRRPATPATPSATDDENLKVDDKTMTASNRQSVVRARLHLFEEVIASKSTDNPSLSVSPKTEEAKEKEEKIEEIEDKAVEKQFIVEKTEESGEIVEIAEEEDEKVSHEENKVPKITVQEICENSKDQEIDDEEVKEEAAGEKSEIASYHEEIVKIDEKDVPEKVGEDILKPEESNKKDEDNNLVKEEIKTEPEKSPSPVVQLPAQKVRKPEEEEYYPEDLNPFKSDEEEEEENLKPTTPVKPARKISNSSTSSASASVGNSAHKYSEKERRKSLNPFDSSDDEVEMEKKAAKPPRPPPPKITKNPFGDEAESDGLTGPKRTPVPTPRHNVSNASRTTTPEPTPRVTRQSLNASTPLNNSGDFYGSSASLGTPNNVLRRGSDERGSNNSLTSSTGTMRTRKSRKAPAPPPPGAIKELFPSTETVSSSKKSSPSSSSSTTPAQSRKKRPAPAPPKPARLDLAFQSLAGSKNLQSSPLQSQLDKLSDEEKALLEGRTFASEKPETENPTTEPVSLGRRLIEVDPKVIEEALKVEEEPLRRKLSLLQLDMSPIATNLVEEPSDSPVHDRQLEKLKDNKEANNRSRQSHSSIGGYSDDSDPLYNKSSHGKWKRRKGPAPGLPIPPRKVLQMLPLQEIRHELDIIEVQQQGLEKQGVILEKMIRDRCEGKNGELNANDSSSSLPNTKEVEDLILQLFELVNEKNELFRRQAELMYLRRQHRLEQEQADLEYEIRVLMAQPERNKTDSDKAREEALIARLVEVVQLRNEVVDCLEMDRLREAEEDLSIKQRLESHTARRDEEQIKRQTLSKLSKKEKKKQKEAKKLAKSKKLDVDKDADESELSVDKKAKKKKKKFLGILTGRGD